MTTTDGLSSGVSTDDIDFDAVHAKYLAERDKRLRPDGNDQYIEVKDQFAHYVDDPYVEADFTRDHQAPITRPTASSGQQKQCQ